MKECLEHLRFTIGRYDHYYDSINNKAAFLLALNTALTGGYFVLWFEYAGKAFIVTSELEWWLWMCFVFCFVSILMTLTAVAPFIGKCVRSNMFFASVALRTPDQFYADILQETNASRVKDCTVQVQALATGLKRKFNLLGGACVFLAINFISAAFLAIHILRNLTTPNP